MVLIARLSTLSHALAIASRTRAHAASPLMGTTPGSSSSGGYTSKYCDPGPWINSRWQCTRLQPSSTCSWISFCAARQRWPPLLPTDQSCTSRQYFFIALTLRSTLQHRAGSGWHDNLSEYTGNWLIWPGSTPCLHSVQMAMEYAARCSKCWNSISACAMASMRVQAARCRF
jgi:hypothetical protein